MRKLVASLVLSLALCLPAPGQPFPLEVKGEAVKTLTVVGKFPVTVHGSPGADVYIWSASAGVTFTDLGDKVEVLSAPQGESTVSCRMISIDWTAKKVVTKFGQATFTVGNLPPGPKPPDPKPPEPNPPTPVAGMKVLILEESGDRSKLPPAQLASLFSTAVQSYLTQKCKPAPGSVYGWMIADKDTNLSKVAPDLEILRQRPRQSLPWVIVSGDGGVVFEGPWPGSTAEAVKFLQKWGG